MPDNCISVKQLNLYVKSLLEGDSRLAFITVKGELSNFKNHYSSGHWYFTLKDREASIRCVMFRFSASRVRFVPSDGMSVILSGRVSIYEKDGQYQFYAEEMHAEGEGQLSLAFKLTKEKLEKEGLFDTDSKRPICKYPEKIAVITSDTGAAVQDIINVTARRYPLCRLLLCPVAVQGASAVPDMLNALDRVYLRDDVDTIIIGRGGGSEEDLAAFNDELLARKIYESPIPVISAVGHETDFSICDFVADLRAPTPSAAAELAVPDIAELLNRIKRSALLCSSVLKSKYNLYLSKTEFYRSYFTASRLNSVVDYNFQLIDSLLDRAQAAAKATVNTGISRFETAVARLDALSPTKTLMRGFAAVSKSGVTVKSTDNLSLGDRLTLKMYDGELECDITDIHRRNNDG